MNEELKLFRRFLNGDMPKAEWEAYQEIIKSKPETYRAIEQLDRINRIVEQWNDGFIHAHEATDMIGKIFE